MTRTQDMFAELKPPRSLPRELMHVCDVNGCADEGGTGAMVRLKCARCGQESEWVYFSYCDRGETWCHAQNAMLAPTCIGLGFA